MFSIEKNNEKVGAYLKRLIEKKYPSHRQFCREYLELQGIEVDNEELRKMSNRLSQIIKGKKAIQTYDLPFFTELLGVSCEDLLSCGKTFVPISGHITNYEIAFSKDPAVWQKYVNDENKLILNTDEYFKTILDYALEFKNYGLIKYLMDNGYIWFVDESEYDRSDFIVGFGAGTSIQRRDFSWRDYGLTNQMSAIQGEEVRLRKGMITLALENEDFDTLTELRAKEIPALLQLVTFLNADISCYDYYDDELIDLISRSGDKVLKYFAEPYQREDRWGYMHTFIYPFLGDVIEKLVENKSKYAEPMLRLAIEYNQSVFNKLQGMVNDASQLAQDRYAGWDYKPGYDSIIKEALDYYRPDKEEGYFTYFYPKAKHETPKYSANVIMTEAESDDLLLSSLIKQLNNLYKSVMNIKPTNLKEEKQ